MTVDELRNALQARGGEADVWVVLEEDGLETTLGKGFRLAPRAAFWKRGEAYSYAFARNARTVWRHYYVYCLHADALWAWSESPRDLRFETVFHRAKEEPRVSLTPVELASLAVR